MRCSGCGKDIPFGGSVCPYCQRDKSKDKAYTVAAFVFGSVAGFIGYYIFGFWGAVFGFIVGCVAAAIITNSVDSKPPQVEVVNMQTVAKADESIADQLSRLKNLHNKGLLSDDEFSYKKSEILKKF
jgi:glutaredoxin